jgi:hypothetical protein
MRNSFEIKIDVNTARDAEHQLHKMYGDLRHPMVIAATSRKRDLIRQMDDAIMREMMDGKRKDVEAFYGMRKKK